MQRTHVMSYVDQVRVRASDNGVPACMVYEVVYLTLSLNENTPVWLRPNANQQYRDTVQVLETVSFNSPIYTFSSSDNDIVSQLYYYKTVELVHL